MTPKSTETLIMNNAFLTLVSQHTSAVRPSAVLMDVATTSSSLHCRVHTYTPAWQVQFKHKINTSHIYSCAESCIAHVL